MSRRSLMRSLLVLAAVGAWCGFTLPAAAQPINLGARPAGSANELHLAVGVENAFVATVGYSHGIRVFDEEIVLSGDLTVPWADLDLADFRLRLGGLVPLVGSSSWKLMGKAMPLLRGTHNAVNRMTSLGIDAGLMGGYYSQHWFIAAEAGVDWAAATYIEHSARYRETSHPDARDGWYAMTGANVYAGLLGGRSFSSWDLVLRAGQIRDYRTRPQTIPFYLTAGVNIRLPTAP